MSLQAWAMGPGVAVLRGRPWICCLRSRASVQSLTASSSFLASMSFEQCWCPTSSRFCLSNNLRASTICCCACCTVLWTAKHEKPLAGVWIL